MVDRKQDVDHLFWLDMEMTGLDPEKENIIEIASLITDKDLNVLEHGPNLVIKQPDELLAKMDDWNQKQHSKTGLIDEVKNSLITLVEAEEQTLAFLKGYCFPKTTPLCGSGVHHDRRFIIKYMPALNEYLNYRLVDVSSFKAMVRRWYPKAEGLPYKETAHRAKADVLESIGELKHIRENFFK